MTYMTYKDAYEKIEQFKYNLSVAVVRGNYDVILGPEDAKELLEAFNLIFV